jgi:hypothetical protein
VIFDAKADKHAKFSRFRLGVKGWPPVFRQTEETWPYPVGRKIPAEAGKQIKEKVERSAAGSALINTQYRREGSPLAVFFPGSAETVQDYQVPFFPGTFGGGKN